MKQIYVLSYKIEYDL